MKVQRIIPLVLACIFLMSVISMAQEKAMKKIEKPKQGKSKMADAKAKDVVVIETSMGTIEAQLYPADAPKTVENFEKLAGKKYFDGMRVHRIAKNFVIQTGDDKSKDPSLADSWGTGGQSVWGKEFADELNPNTPSFKAGYVKGVLAMANRGPNTNTSQFFICLGDVGLPHSYTIFGKVISGMDVVDKIGAVEIIPGSMGPTDGRPKTEVLVKSISLKK